jgi:hypothetical protein
MCRVVAPDQVLDHLQLDLCFILLSHRFNRGRIQLDKNSLLSYPDSKRVELKPPYVCLGRSNHTYNNNMIIK